MTTFAIGFVNLTQCVRQTVIIIVKSKAQRRVGEDGMRKLIESKTSKPSGIEVAGGRDIK